MARRPSLDRAGVGSLDTFEPTLSPVGVDGPVAEPALGAPLTRAHDALECDAVARLLDHLAVAVAHEPFDPSPNPEGLAAEREHLDVEPKAAFMPYRH
jgi:hypothetical protein